MIPPIFFTCFFHTFFSFFWNSIFVQPTHNVVHILNYQWKKDSHSLFSYFCHTMIIHCHPDWNPTIHIAHGAQQGHIFLPNDTRILFYADEDTLEITFNEKNDAYKDIINFYTSLLGEPLDIIKVTEHDIAASRQNQWYYQTLITSKTQHEV